VTAPSAVRIGGRVWVAVLVFSLLERGGTIHKIITGHVVYVPVAVVIDPIQVGRVKPAVAIQILCVVHPKLAGEIRMIEVHPGVNHPNPDIPTSSGKRPRVQGPNNIEMVQTIGV
jgi:hypothetical protein